MASTAATTKASAMASPARRKSNDFVSGARRGSVLGLQIFVEERDGPRPGELGRGLVIARCRIVVEAVIGIRVHEHLVFHAVRLERRLKSGPAGIDAVVEARVLDQQGRLDFGSVGSA